MTQNRCKFLTLTKTIIDTGDNSDSPDRQTWLEAASGDSKKTAQKQRCKCRFSAAVIMQMRLAFWASRAAFKLGPGGSTTRFMCKAVQGWWWSFLGEQPQMLAEKDPAYTAANLTAFSFPAKGLNSIPTILAHLTRKNHESTPPHIILTSFSYLPTYVS